MKGEERSNKKGGRSERGKDKIEERVGKKTREKKAIIEIKYRRERTRETIEGFYT